VEEEFCELRLLRILVRSYPRSCIAGVVFVLWDAVAATVAVYLIGGAVSVQLMAAIS
jgi:hypothetical protein